MTDNRNRPINTDGYVSYEIPAAKLTWVTPNATFCIQQPYFKWYKRLYIMITNPFRYVFLGKWYL